MRAIWKKLTNKRISNIYANKILMIPIYESTGLRKISNNVNKLI